MITSAGIFNTRILKSFTNCIMQERLEVMLLGCMYNYVFMYVGLLPIRVGKNQG